MQLRKILKSQMKHKGINTRMLSELTGVSEGTLKTWLSGASPRSLEDARKVAMALNISFEHLIFGGETETNGKIVLDENGHSFEGYLKIEIRPLHPHAVNGFHSIKKRESK